MLGACHPTYIVHEQSAPAPAPAPAPVQQEEVSYQNFYDELSPYGHWIDYPGYGYVWMPAVGPDFKPYATNGYWIYTDMGWTWTSNYNWGWAPFHYGRWFYEGGYGWMWMPGNEWSPAWVSWRRSNDYYGWAPLGPNVRMDVYGGSYNPPSNYWCFVPHQYISNPRINNYYVNETRNVTIINNTTIINSRVVNVTNNNNTRINNNVRTVYVNGPDRQEVERVTGSPIRPAVIRENNRPGEQVNNGQYTIYRPRVNSAPAPAAGNQARIAPARVESLRDIRPMPSSGQTNNNQPVIRNNNNTNTAAPSNNNNARPTENLPAPNVRPQQNIDNNQPVNNRFNNRDNNPANNPANENQPVIRSNTNTPAPVNNNNQPVNNRFNNRDNNPANNQANGNQPVIRSNANTPTPVNNNQPANTRIDNRNNNSSANNNTITNPSNNTRPANGNHPINNSTRLNNKSQTNNDIRNNSTNAGQNDNKNANQLNQRKKPNASNNARSLEKKEKKDE